ncbi:MAG TPA: hypothetical protein PK939_07765 [Bacteroidales bacterium]|nr:hypothetical protein [Bacteroidales bacterium]HQQ12868.1 hypothetical protein [Bacteroidales bacterium]
MKTFITIAIIAASISGLNAANTTSFTSDSDYINDIPFDTHSIFSQIKANRAMAIDYRIAEEEYVNDIPFDTEKIAQLQAQKNTLHQLPKMEAEAEINDIPFDTAEIAARYIQK